MITTMMFWGLAGLAAILAGYSFIDNDNRILGHVFCAGVVIVLLFLLGITMITGSVGDYQAVAVNETTINATVSYTYDTIFVASQDRSVGYLFIGGGVGMLIYFILLILELFGEIAAGRAPGWDDDDEF
jgi:hypothetical protein